jgi:hypothetical protein
LAEYRTVIHNLKKQNHGMFLLAKRVMLVAEPDQVGMLPREKV